MPVLADRKPENILGRFYVDSTCIDCDLCRNTAPDFFRRDADSGQSFVYRKPVTTDEIALAQDALAACPTDSIGDDAAEV
jgi:ferredoxin